jgi:hypothetical protein
MNAMPRMCIGNDVVPIAIPAQCVRVGDVIRQGWLCEEWRYGGQCDDKDDFAYNGSFLSEVYTNR